MPKTYKEIYNDIIGTAFNAAVISYDPVVRTFRYLGYSHKVESNALDDIVNVIVNDMVFYAYSEEEILKLNKDYHILSDLCNAAMLAYNNRLPKRSNPGTDGIVGEILLDILIQLASNDTKKLIARARYTEVNSKKEITGYDAVYFVKTDTEIELWLGQAKSGKDTYCKTGIIDDLNNKYKKEYFADLLFYLADRSEAKELEEFLHGINKICFEALAKGLTKDEKANHIVKYLKDSHVKLKIPCLMTYTKDIYQDKNTLKTMVEQEISRIANSLDSHVFPIEITDNYEIVFYIMPVANIDYVREQIAKFKGGSV